MVTIRSIWVACILTSIVTQPSCSCSDLSEAGDTDAESDSSLDLPWDHWADSTFDTWFTDAAPEVSDDLVIETADENPFWCPPPLDVISEFVVDGDSSPDSPYSIDKSCTVGDIRNHSITEGLTLSLGCEDDTTHTLDLIPYPPIIVALAIGNEVVLYYRAAPTPEDPDLYERWLRIESPAGELIIVAIDASSLYSDEGVDIFFPVTCNGSASCDRLVTSCYDEERLRLLFSCLEGHCLYTGVWDGREGWIGSGTMGFMYHIRVGEAKRRDNISCPGITNHWHRILMSLD